MKKISAILTYICMFAAISIFTSTVKAQDEVKVEGTVVSVDAAAGKITIDVAGTKKDFTITSGKPNIRVNSNDAGLDAVKEGMWITYVTETPDSNVIKKIRAKSKK